MYYFLFYVFLCLFLLVHVVYLIDFIAILPKGLAFHLSHRV